MLALESVIQDERSEGVTVDSNGTVWYEGREGGGAELTQTQQKLMSLKCNQPTQVSTWGSLNLEKKGDTGRPQEVYWNRDMRSMGEKVVGMREVARLGRDPCGQERGVVTNQLYFCYGPGVNETVIMLDLSTFSIGGWAATTWLPYVWYLDLRGSERWLTWKMVSHIIGKKFDRASYGGSEKARIWQDRLRNVRVTGQGNTKFLSMTLNQTNYPLPGNVPRGGSEWAPGCTTISVCVSKVGRDTCTRVYLCPNKTAFEEYGRKNQTESKTILTRGGKSVSSVQVKVLPGLRKVDDWFLIHTGISMVTNNWLRMAEQAANTTNGNCLVCLEPRPILRIIAAGVIAPNCIVQFLYEKILTGDCTELEKVFPLTGLEKKKPMFNTQVHSLHVQMYGCSVEEKCYTIDCHPMPQRPHNPVPAPWQRPLAPVPAARLSITGTMLNHRGVQMCTCHQKGPSGGDLHIEDEYRLAKRKVALVVIEEKTLALDENGGE
ncbi:uncharacterized protein LOC133504984 [Syngnathoides biaculeatus]|uniref:uncharacterized protein LOC133504984 n=1 Tax=Syngnathoides biaculeatus TaxID=300417 RepID=UPI002ADDEA01|nr:uncharacterized protein LOC133504984 [Syngnathoides biaculeatus]